MDTSGFAGAGVIVLETRMAEAMCRSVASHGGRPISAPAVREVPLEQNQPAVAFGETLCAGGIDVAVFLTGVGTRQLLDVVCAKFSKERIVEALSRATVVARGPKPARALKEFGVPVTLTVPEPNTWREIVDTLDQSSRSVDLDGRTVAVQEYGVSNARLIEALEARHAKVIPVPVYRWTLPEDIEPLHRAIRAAIDGRATFIIFTNAAQVRHLFDVARTTGDEAVLRKALGRLVVASVGPTTTEALVEVGAAVDFEPSHPKMGPLIDELARQAQGLLAEKASPRPALLAGAAADDRGVTTERHDATFLRACRRLPTPVTPVWIMRQAGRYLKSYRQLRSKVSFLTLCKSPELAAEVTVDAVRAIGADAAILFSDILLPVEPLGLALEYESSEGPVISGHVSGREGVDRLRELEPLESLPFVFDAIRRCRSALPPHIPLIGFAGAPFTLAAYIVEGGGSKNFLNTKRLMYSDPGAWRALLEKISRGLIKFLSAQIDAGADAVQLFDSWVGCLGPKDYEEYVLPHSRAVLQAVAGRVPVIHFGTGTGPFLPAVARAGGDVIGVDFRVELDAAWRLIGHERGIQGNLDPAVLTGPPTMIRQRVRRILDQAEGRAGHIFNLGHGVLPQTPEDHVRILIDAVHDLSRR